MQGAFCSNRCPAGKTWKQQKKKCIHCKRCAPAVNFSKADCKSKGLRSYKWKGCVLKCRSKEKYFNAVTQQCSSKNKSANLS